MKIDAVKLGPYNSYAAASGALKGLELSRSKDGNVSVGGEPEESEDGLWYVNATVTVEEPDSEDEEEAANAEGREQQLPKESDEAGEAYFLLHGTLPRNETVAPDDASAIPENGGGDSSEDLIHDWQEDLLVGEEDKNKQDYEIDVAERNDVADAANDTVGNLQEQFQKAEDVDHNVTAAVNQLVQPEPSEPAPSEDAGDDEEGDGEGEEEKRYRLEQERILALASEGPAPSPIQSA